MEKYLVINAGSSSLKFSLYEMPNENLIVNGIVEKIGEEDSSYTLKFNGKKIENSVCVNNHNVAVKLVLSLLLSYKFVNNLDEINGIGHRTVHGAEKYDKSVLIDEEVITHLKEYTKLASIHHPSEIEVIRVMQEILPNIDNVAVFDTSFHQTIPDYNYMYATPYEWYEKYKVRKYGFHGTSHKYITGEMKKRLNKEDVNLIICHIGSGVSISAIKDGKCYNTTMGLTPLDGVVMGTRSGSIDASIIEYISKETNKSIDEIMNDLNQKSGLLGISGKNDFRDLRNLVNNGDKKAILAYNMFKTSIINYIGQYYFQLKGNVDSIVFTAGIGENEYLLREDVVNSFPSSMGIKIDNKLNKNIGKKGKYLEGNITTSDSKILVCVVPTDEEIMILYDTYEIVNNKKKEKGRFK